MKTKSTFLILAIFMVAISIQAQEYKLVWEDNFNGNTIDESKWNIEQKEGIWNTGANSEFQHYKKENIIVGDDGNGNNCLIITAKKEEHNGYAYTSGKVDTKGKFAFKSGKMEAFIKIPDLANGLWPAFWTIGYTPIGWPDCGEIDVLEMGHAKGIEDDVQNSFIGAHLFWGPYPSDWGKEFVAAEDLSTGYFKHTLIWDEEKISVYFNDAETPYFSMGISGDDTEEFRDYQHFIILNMAVGGSVPGIYNADEITANFPASMYVDWVKVYQEESAENHASNLPLFGNFGVYEDESMVEMRMDLNYDLHEALTTLTPREEESPYEGENALSYDATGAFECKLNASLPRNFTNYNTGSLQFYIKTAIQDDFVIGIADTNGVSTFKTFSINDEDAFARDETWQLVYVELENIEETLDLSALKDLLIIKGESSSNSYFSIDKVMFSETVPAKGYYAIFSDNPNITDGFIVDNVNNNLYIWNNTVAFNEYYPAYEGENVHSFKATGSESWFGFGYNSGTPLNFEAYADGYLNISIRTESTNDFYIGMDTESTDGVINFTSGNDPYGFERDGNWYHLNIPFSDLTANGLDLSSVVHVFKTGGGGAIGNIAYDNIYYSETLPDIENSMLCFASKINITPKNATLALNKSLTFKAEVTNQFGNAYENNVVWSSNGGTINDAGNFTPDTIGQYTISATIENVTDNTTIDVVASTDIKNTSDYEVTSYINNATKTLHINNMESTNNIRLYNANGQIIYSTQAKESNMNINMQQFPAGIYIIKVASAKGTYTNKVIVR